MLIAAKDYAKYGLDPTDASLEFKLSVIEHKIRSATNNGFHVSQAVSEAPSYGGVLSLGSALWRVGDTVDISRPDINAGLYVIDRIDGVEVTFDRPLFDAPTNRAMLVRYPADVVAGAVAMIDYDRRMTGKAGVASESLSRHSVSYVQPTDGNLFKGYPADVTSFMRPYIKARV